MTTVSISENLQHRLQMASRSRKVSVSKLAQQLLVEALEKKEQGRLDEVYSATEKLIGSFTSNEPNLSSNIDKIMYGEKGAWRGTDPMTPEEIKNQKDGK